MNIEKGNVVFGENHEEFRVLENLNSGGFGNIYKVENENKNYVLKVLKESEDCTKNETIFNEANLCLRISHQNVIRFEYFHDGSVYPDFPPYIIMEYAEGGDLDHLLKEHKNVDKFFSNTEILDIFDQLASGMLFINSEKKIVHRDIKPKNILIADQTFKITDFGISKNISEETRDITFKGLNTYLYLAPEEWGGEQKSPLMDIYAMGIVFYNLATLNYPYDGIDEYSNIEKIRNAHKSAEQVKVISFNKNIDPRIVTLIERMIAQDVRLRISSWEEIISRIRSCKEPENKEFENNPLICQAKSLFEKQVKCSRNKSKVSEKTFERMKIVNKQFHRLISDIRNSVEIFNGSSSPYKIKLEEVADIQSSIVFSLDLEPLRKVQIEIIILDENSAIEIEEDIDENYSLIKAKTIWGFGFIKVFNGKGFNFAIVFDDQSSYYGDVIIIKNYLREDVAVYYTKKEPFSFDLHEFAKEICCITDIEDYIYISRLEAYDQAIWFEVISYLLELG